MDSREDDKNWKIKPSRDGFSLRGGGPEAGSPLTTSDLPSHSGILCKRLLSLENFIYSNYLLSVAGVSGTLLVCGPHSPVLCTHPLLRASIWVSLFLKALE